MKQLSHFLPLLLLLWTAVSCSDAFMNASEEQLVVEGWIDADGYPVVLVSTTVSPSATYQDLTALRSHILQWATVTVSDGEQSAVLTEHYDSRYLPYYVYTTARLKGEAGKTYTLTVRYKDWSATAVTTIPEPLPLEDIKVRQQADGQYLLLGCFTDPSETRDCYKFFSLVKGVDSTFVACPQGTAEDSVMDGYVEMPLYHGNSLGRPRDHPYYASGDEVRIKFCRMDEAAYRYWDNYESLTVLSSPLFPVHFNTTGNVEGALGCWIGYGAAFYSVAIP